MTTKYLLLAAALLLPPTVGAADPAPKKGNTLTLGSGKPTGKLLTRDQLRQCLAKQKALKEQDAETAQAQTALDADKAAIARADAELESEAAALQAERAAVDTTKEESIAAFNAKLAQRAERERARDQRVADYNTRLPAFNARVQAGNQVRQGWQADCADRAYDEADYFAIQRGK